MHACFQVVPPSSEAYSPCNDEEQFRSLAPTNNCWALAGLVAMACLFALCGPGDGCTLGKREGAGLQGRSGFGGFDGINPGGRIRPALNPHAGNTPQGKGKFLGAWAL